MKWVKTPRVTFARWDPAVTNSPDCIMSWATPTLRRNVDLPPELAPVMMTSDFPSACTSLPTTAAWDCKWEMGRVRDSTREVFSSRLLDFSEG